MQRRQSDSLAQGFFHRFSRLNRRLKKVQARVGIAPTPAKTRKLHESIMVFFTGSLLFFLYGPGVSPNLFYRYIPDPWPSVGLGLSGLVLTAATLSFLAVLYLYSRESSVVAGQLKPFPFVPHLERTFRTFGFRDKRGKVSFDVATFELDRVNLLAGGAIPLTAVFIVGRVRNRSYDAGLLKQWQEKGGFPGVPEGEIIETLTDMVQLNRKMWVIPGAHLIKVLGGRNDGFDFLRDWIWNEYPNASPLSYIVVIADTLPMAKDLEALKPTAHATTLEAIMADLAADNAELRARLRSTREYNAEDASTEREGRGGLDMEEI